MKKNTRFTQGLAFMLAVTVFFSSCASTTMIHSIPSGAKVYLNGEYCGTTPYAHSDTKVTGSSTSVRLEKDGFKPFYGQFSRNEDVDVGAIIGGFLVLVPFLWTMKYKAMRTYELQPAVDMPYKAPVQGSDIKSKAERLRELKALLDEKIITQEEYEAEKKKILKD